MIRYMLDTNMVSYIIKGYPPEVRKKLEMKPMSSIVISAVTQGELLYGIAHKKHPASLAKVVEEFLHRVDILSWDEEAAIVYGSLRAACSAKGIAVSALDMMIAAHAVATQSTLVTHDQIFSRIENGLVVEDWCLN